MFVVGSVWFDTSAVPKKAIACGFGGVHDAIEMISDADQVSSSLDQQAAGNPM